MDWERQNKGKITEGHEEFLRVTETLIILTIVNGFMDVYHMLKLIKYCTLKYRFVIHEFYLSEII